MKIRHLITGLAIAASAVFISTGAADASYLTKCNLEEGRASATVRCYSVKKTKGKDRLRVAVWVKCSNGDDTIKKTDRTPAKALKDSVAYCPDEMYIIDSGYNVVSK